MAESVQMNLSVLPETKERIKKMAAKDHRGMGDVVDWLVELAWPPYAAEQRVAITEEGRKALAAAAGEPENSKPE